MFFKILLGSLVIGAGVLMTGCSGIPDIAEQSQPQQPQQPQQPMEPYFHSHQRVSDYTDRIANDLSINSSTTIDNTPVALTSLVFQHGPEAQNDQLGNLITESLFGQMQQLGFVPVDIRAIDDIELNSKKGVFAFSRHNQSILAAKNIRHVLIGTMLSNHRGVTVNARIMRIETGVIISSASVFIPSFALNHI